MLIGIDASRAFGKDKTGTENYSKEIIEAILKLPEAKKHEFILYVRNPIRSDLAGLQGRTLQVKEINWKMLWTQGGLALELLKNPVEVLWVPAHTLPVIRNPKIKTVVTIHGLEYEFLPQYYQFPQKLWLNKSTEYAVKQADRLIAVSAWTKKQLAARLGADEKKITVIHEGISPKFINRQFSGEYLRQIRYKYSLPGKYILFVGTVQPRKNLVRLIEAFSKLITHPVCGHLPHRVWNGDLVIVGKLGWMYEEILAAPKKYKVEKRVKFIGRVAEADLAAVYKMAQVFVYPSLMEGFGLPILEALALGIPVITSDRGALPEVAGEGALIINPEKTEEITQAIRLVLENDELRQGLIEKGLRQVKQFSWEKAARETLEILTDW
ncbi:MAG: glycosyltransferase family 1 protein [Candidatus Beckwithbacteria bacterium]|nr:glycosyltransferase family 1 protein [Candidatus Beckwithbacteria bacterium]